MTCNRIENRFICTSNECARLHVGRRHVWVDFHAYLGPTFFYDRDMTKVYIPIDESDPVWPVFERWISGHHAAHQN